MAADGYSRQLAHVVAAQLAEVSGFEAVQESALDVLAELLLRYVSEVGTASHEYAELANRSEVNVADVALALEDVGASVEDLSKYLDEISVNEVGRGGAVGGRGVAWALGCWLG